MIQISEQPVHWESGLGLCFPSFLQISTNGLFSFGRPFQFHTPHLFPGTNNIVAPFWADSDITNSAGQIMYEVHDTFTDALFWVSTFISQQQQTNFSASWMLVAKWDDVPQVHGSTDVVSTVILSQANSLKTILNATPYTITPYLIMVYYCLLCTYLSKCFTSHCLYYSPLYRTTHTKQSLLLMETSPMQYLLTDVIL